MYELVHIVVMRSSHDSKKLSRVIAEYWNEYVYAYQQVAIDYGLTIRQKL